MSLRKALLAATVLALPLSAQAQPVTGVYVAGGAGVNWLSNSDTNNTSYTDCWFFCVYTPPPMSASTNAGWVGLASLGWGFGNGARVEIEGNYRSNSVSGVSLGGIGALNGGGTISSYGVMVNALYDFNLGGWMPYVGAGIGYAWIDWSSVRGTLPVSGGTVVGGVNDSAGAFAYQFMLGAAIPIQAVPGLALTAEYRFFGTASPDINGSYVATSTRGAVTTTAFSFSPTNYNNSLLVGVRYNFGRPLPAPAPVAAAPAPARSFLVFFDFGSDQLTARAREIVGQAAQASRSQQVTRLEVAGHTDTVGSAQYNQGLSLRRANNVAAELVRMGVPREAITTAGFGFSRPLVPTGANVREPQNRRVEIVLR